MTGWVIGFATTATIWIFREKRDLYRINCQINILCRIDLKYNHAQRILQSDVSDWTVIITTLRARIYVVRTSVNLREQLQNEAGWSMSSQHCQLEWVLAESNERSRCRARKRERAGERGKNNWFCTLKIADLKRCAPKAKLESCLISLQKILHNIIAGALLCVLIGMSRKKERRQGFSFLLKFFRGNIFQLRHVVKDTNMGNIICSPRCGNKRCFSERLWREVHKL